MITTIFWDLGGVLLTNAWDRHARGRACEHFGLDCYDFEDRHEQVVGDFETGRMDLDTYLDRTIFYEARSFGKPGFRTFMFEQSQEEKPALDFVRRLHATGRYRLAVVNNESYELNAYRIEQFRLRECFDLFFSSCFVRVRKPDPGMYRLALEVTQTPPGDALLVDDRAINVEAARGTGMVTIRYRDLDQLRACMAEMGVQAA